MKRILLLTAVLAVFAGMGGAVHSGHGVLHYRLNQSSCGGAGSVTDFSGANNDGDCNAATVPGFGQENSTGNWDTGIGYNFTEGDAEVDQPSLDLSQNYTITAWVWFDSVNDGDFDGVFDFRDIEDIYVREESGSLKFVQDATTVASTSVSSNQWYFIALRWNSASDTAEAFKYTSSIGTASLTGTGTTGGTSALGSVAGSSDLDGAVDEFRVWKKPLNSSQLENLFNTNCPGFGDCPDLNSPPAFDSTDHDPDNPVVGDAVTVQANTSDSDGDDVQAWASVSYGNGTTIVPTTPMDEPNPNDHELVDAFTVTDAATYFINYTASDGTKNSTASDQFTVTDEPPTVTINNPDNQTYSSDPPFNVQINDTDDVPGETFTWTVWRDGHQVDSGSGLENLTVSGTITSSVQGNQTFKANATDDAGNLGRDIREYKYDTQPPTVSIKEPTPWEPNRSSIPVNYTVSDISNTRCWYEINQNGTVFSQPGCSNTTLSFPQIGTHNITLYSQDQYGNGNTTATQTFLADALNGITLQDADTGNTIQKFSVTYDNGTNSFGGSTSTGLFTFNTSDLPTGNNTVTLKSSGYEAKNLYETVTASYQVNKTFQMQPAEVAITVYEESTNTLLDNPVILTFTNETDTVTASLLNKYKSSSGTVTDPAAAFDRNTQTFATIGDDNNQGTLIGWVALTETSDNTVVYKGNADGSGVDIDIWNADTQSWEDLGDPPSFNGNKTFTVNNSGGQYNGKIRMRTVGPADVKELYANHLKQATFDFSDIPTGKVKLTVEEINAFNEYKPRQYIFDNTGFLSINLRAYLLAINEGLQVTVEVQNQQQDAVENALITISREFNTVYRTIGQRKSTSSGTATFFLDDDTSYRATVTHPAYVAFEGTFSPSAYEFDNFLITLASASTFQFSTVWGSVSTRLLPSSLHIPAETVNINWTVADSKSKLSSFALQIRNKTTLLNKSTVTSSPSGGTITLTPNLTGYPAQSPIYATATFTRNGTTYTYNKTYYIARDYDTGDYSAKEAVKLLTTNTSSHTQAFLALILTFFVATLTTGLIGQNGGGMIALTSIGFFAFIGWLPGLTFIVTLLGLAGLYSMRG